MLRVSRTLAERVGELALTLMLLSGAGFMMRSFMALYRLDPGVETEGLVTMQIYLPLTKYPEMEPRRVVYTDLLDRLGTAPEVASSTLATAWPLDGGGLSGVELGGRIAEEGVERPEVTTVTVSEDYFDVMRIELLQGRNFNREDGLPGSQVAVVNQRFVDLHMRDGDPRGRTVRVTYEGASVSEAEWLTVVRVAPTIRHRVVQQREPDPVVYLPLRLNPSRGIRLAVRSRGDVAGVSALVRETLQLVEPDVPIFNIMTMDQQLAEERWPFRVFGILIHRLRGHRTDPVGGGALLNHRPLGGSARAGIRHPRLAWG